MLYQNITIVIDDNLYDSLQQKNSFIRELTPTWTTFL